MQADTWFVGLRAVISRTHHHRMVDPLKSKRGTHSCISSPAGYMRRKQNLGLSAKTIRPFQVLDICHCFIKFSMLNLVINGLSSCIIPWVQSSSVFRMSYDFNLVRKLALTALSLDLCEWISVLLAPDSMNLLQKLLFPVHNLVLVRGVVTWR